MSDEEKKVDAAAASAADAIPAQEPVAEAPATEPAAEPATDTSPQEEPAEAVEPEEAPPAYLKKLENLDELKPGMTIRLHERIKDVSPKGEERERIQIFEGMILGIRGAGFSRTMTIRKVSKGFGVEKIYPINSPVIAKMELVKAAKVRKAKLWYLANIKRRFKRRLRETWA